MRCQPIREADRYGEEERIIDESAARNATLEWRFDKVPINRVDVQRVEVFFKLRLPAYYVDIVLAHHGARPRPHRFDTEAKLGHTVKTFLPVIRRCPSNVYDVYEWIRDRLPAGCVPFASDECGNYICFEYKAGVQEPTVILWLHESGMCEPVADSYRDFLNRLY
ncbi:SMI1 / KNR4 family (SUKH-1) [Paenibacillus sp. yr247]|nr:SMI1 / KNR4 family (SUKH-1) [Paenibacillus sp. yr247]